MNATQTPTTDSFPSPVLFEGNQPRQVSPPNDPGTLDLGARLGLFLAVFVFLLLGLKMVIDLISALLR